MGSNLVERLDSIKHLKDDVYVAFNVPHIDPTDFSIRINLPYGKDELVNLISYKIKGSKEDNSNFAKTLSNSLPYVKNGKANPLKRVNYGIQSTGNLSKSFLDALTNWEKVYLFRGRWSERKPIFYEDFNLFVFEHLISGITHFEESFSKFRNYQRRVLKKNYSSVPLSESKSIVEQYKEYLKFGKEIKKMKNKKGKLPKKTIWTQASLF